MTNGNGVGAVEAEPVREFQRRLIAAQDLVAAVRSTGQHLAIRSDATVVLFHGTSESNAKAIRASGVFHPNTWFAPSRAATLAHAVPRHGKNTTVIEVAVEPRHIEFSTGTGEFYSAGGLVRSECGVWVESIGAPEQPRDRSVALGRPRSAG